MIRKSEPQGQALAAEAQSRSPPWWRGRSPPWWRDRNPIRKGELWEQKRSRAARLGGVAGVRSGGETLVDKARSRTARLGGVAGVRPGGETLVDR